MRDGLGGLIPDRVGDAENPADVTGVAHNNQRVARVLHLDGHFMKVLVLGPDVLDESVTSHPEFPALNGALGPFALDDLIVFGGDDRNVFGPASAENGAREGMRTVNLQRGSSAEQLPTRVAVHGNDPHDLGTAMGQRSGFIHGDGLQPGGRLQIGSPLDQHSRPRCRCQTRHDADGGGDHEGTGTGDHQNHQPLVKPCPPRSARQERGEHGDHEREGHHHRCVNAREAIDPELTGSAARLRFLDQPYDAGQRCIGRGFGRAKLKRGIAVDRSRENIIADHFHDRERFSGNRSLVDGRFILGDDAVEGDFLSRTNRKHRAHRHVLDVAFFDGAVLGGNNARRIGREFDQGLDRAPGAPHAPGLQQERQSEEERDDGRLEPLADPHRSQHGDEHQEIHVGAQTARRVPRLGSDRPAPHDDGSDIESQAQGWIDVVRRAASPGQRVGEAPVPERVPEKSASQAGARNPAEDSPALAAPKGVLLPGGFLIRGRAPGDGLRAGRLDRANQFRLGAGIEPRRDVHPAA